MKRSQFLKQALCSLVAITVVAACGGTDQAITPGETISGPWIIGTEPAFPPFESKGNDGELIGFDIELMEAIGEQAGVEVEFESLPFDGLIPALQAGTIEGAISSMTITEERANAVDFSRPYFRTGLAIAVANDKSDIQTIDDLEGKTIAVQMGTTGAKMAGNIQDAKVTTFDSAPLALQELANGNADAVINDAPATLDEIASGNVADITIIDELLTEEFYGIALPKDSPNREALNAALVDLLENGTYDAIYKKWFGVVPEGNLPATAF